MSSTEEILERPNTNGLDKSPEKGEQLPAKIDLKSSTMTDGEISADKQKELNDTEGGGKMSVDENHDEKTEDVEMKESKEKTPEREQNAKKEEILEDKSGEEKIECVKVTPLTEEAKKDKETKEQGDEEEEEEGAEGAEEHEEETEKSTSPKKRAARKRSPKKKAAKKGRGAPKKSTEEKSPDKEEEHEKTPTETKEKSETTPESPKKSPRKRQRTPEKESADTSPKSSKSTDKTPLLEAPLIVEGKRTRQRVERLDTQMLTPTQKEIDIPQGKGAKFSEIAFIDAMISKTQTNDLKALHKLIFGRPGTPQEIKKNLRGFCGLGVSEESKEFDKKKKSLDHSCQIKDLKKICEVLGLERSGRKEELVESVMKFLVEPKDQGKKAPQPAAKRKRSSAGASSSRKRASGGKRRSKKGGDKKESSAESGGDDDDDEEEEHEEEEEEEKAAAEESEEQDKEEDEPKRKKSRKSEKASTSKAGAAAPTPSQRGQPKRAAKKPTYPTDTEIKNTIKELLKGMNLEEVTMKEMTKKVYDKYPTVDITSKKDFIKETVKSLLSSSD